MWFIIYSPCFFQEFSQTVYSDPSAHVSSGTELLHYSVFHRYLQSNLVTGICRRILKFVQWFSSVVGCSPPMDFCGPSNDFPSLNLDKVLLKVSSSSLVTSWLQLLCQSNHDLVLFFARCILEQLKATPEIFSISVCSILSPVVIALREIFCLKSSSYSYLHLVSAAMGCRAFFSQPHNQRISFKLVSESMLASFAQGAAQVPLECDIKLVIKVARALVVATASNSQSPLKDVLSLELHQAITMCGSSVEMALSLEHDVVALISAEPSASATFAKLSLEQIFNTFAPIVASMQEILTTQGNAASIDRVCLVLACTLFAAFMQLKEGDHQEVSSASAAQLPHSNPSLFKWFTFFVNQHMISSFLDHAPLLLHLNNRTYMRCAVIPTLKGLSGAAVDFGAASAHPLRATPSVIESRTNFNSEAVTSVQPPLVAKPEELLWAMVDRHQPLLTDTITSALLHRYSGAELDELLNFPLKLQSSITECLSALHLVGVLFDTQLEFSPCF
jgi:hypothetical protein